MANSEKATDQTSDPVSEIPRPEETANRLNDQIQDAVSQLQSILSGTEQSTLQAAAYQAFVQVVTMAMHNAVAEQQHGQILRMAMTTSAANAILVGRKAEAESLLELARSRLVAPDCSELLAQVRQAIELVGQELGKINPRPTPSTESAASA